MKREIIRTEDGSTTIRLPEWDECYHSTHGAIQEAYHVFINNGLSLFASPVRYRSGQGKPISVMEIGFGTGLNAFITYLEASKMNMEVDYVGVEAYPISADEVAGMNYVSELRAESDSNIFRQMHESDWEQQMCLSQNFKLTKNKLFFDDITYKNKFDLIYFDAFGYRAQPELWRTEIFKIMYDALKDKGILVTYAARGVVKRSLQEVGFRVEKLEGPPGKREMMRAFKE
ncbi:MAG TPA: tRNA (5-methylaminomethyl-2-thiouridine)(34)-methyltransferase MnmD [Flavobacterium sp.]|nr:tRNA (5-methylaminomethyl-2-thiouridine)(34)-methyltransferase MnmD [Flavobacterium sp.]